MMLKGVGRVRPQAKQRGGWTLARMIPRLKDTWLMGQSKRIISYNFLENSREGQLQKEFNYLTKENVDIWIICGQTAMFYFQRMSDIQIYMLCLTHRRKCWVEMVRAAFIVEHLILSTPL